MPHYLEISKIQIFANIQQIWKNANKLHFQCIDFNILCVQLCMVSVLMCFYQNLVLVAECHVNC